MRAYLFLGGPVTADALVGLKEPEEGDLLVAADSGYDNAKKLGLAEQVKVLVGDMDSLAARDLPTGLEVIRLPAEKDLTDTQAALDIALREGATEITLLGGIAGRLDHSLSNLCLLEDLAARGIYAVAADGINRARCLTGKYGASVLLARSAHYKYFSLLALSDEVRGVTVEGGKYPLKDAKLSRRLPYAVSNEIVKNCALVSIRKGSLLVVESRDPASL